MTGEEVEYKQHHVYRSLNGKVSVQMAFIVTQTYESNAEPSTTINAWHETYYEFGQFDKSPDPLEINKEDNIQGCKKTAKVQYVWYISANMWILTTNKTIHCYNDYLNNLLL